MNADKIIENVLKKERWREIENGEKRRKIRKKKRNKRDNVIRKRTKV